MAGEAAGGAGLGGGIGSAIGGGIGLAFAGKSGKEFYKKALAAVEKLKLSDFDMRALSAPELRAVSEAFPDLYQEVVRGGPSQINEPTQGRDAQVRGLTRFEQIAREGLPTAERIASEDAQRAMAAQAKNVNEGILQDLAQRGQLSSGDEISARMAAGQQAHNLAAQQGSNLAMLGIQNRMQGMQGAQGIAGQMRGQDIQVGGQNADLMNRFNELASQLGSERARYNAGAQERSQLYNVGNRQRISDTNALSRYETGAANLDRQNRLRGQSTQERFGKTRMLQDAYNNMGGFYDNQRAARIALGQGIGQGVGSSAGGLLGGYL